MQLKWRELDSELSELPQIFLDWPIRAVVTSDIQLDVFVDASESAYAAALYASVTNSEGKISCKLIAAKTRLAPIKQLTVPRLELCAAHLGANLMESSLRAISKSRFTINQLFAWTGSMIVLVWLSDLPRRWSCFVANRVAKIQEILPPDKWKHASSQDNPADCASRGTSLQQLKNADLWWRGPNWLACFPTEWPKDPVVRGNNMPEEKRSFAAYQQTNQSVIEVNRFSNFNRLVRTMATVLRAVDVMKKRHHQCSDLFTVEELSSAHNSLIKEHQSVNFVKQISELTNNGEDGKKSSLKNLSPFSDSIGLLRVGGRLSQSEYSFDKRSPILI